MWVAERWWGLGSAVVTLTRVLHPVLDAATSYVRIIEACILAGEGEKAKNYLEVRLEPGPGVEGGM